MHTKIFTYTRRHIFYSLIAANYHTLCVFLFLSLLHLIRSRINCISHQLTLQSLTQSMCAYTYNRLNGATQTNKRWIFQSTRPFHMCSNSFASLFASFVLLLLLCWVDKYYGTSFNQSGLRSFSCHAVVVVVDDVCTRIHCHEKIVTVCQATVEWKKSAAAAAAVVVVVGLVNRDRFDTPRALVLNAMQFSLYFMI